MRFKQGHVLTRTVCFMTVVALIGGFVLADMLRCRSTTAAVTGLPEPTRPVGLSAPADLPVLTGMRIDPERPLAPEFLLDTGDARTVSDEEVASLIQYFLAALTVPENDLWVNLSPYEQNRVLAPGLEATGLGRDLMAQDYLLKQLASSLTHPDTETGKAYWAQTNSEIQNSKSETGLAKVWIVPDLAAVKEEGLTVVITDASLKVMTENDYLAMQRNEGHGESSMNALLPAIAKDVNEGANFARLRQIYRSLILAKWFRTKLKESLFAAYIDAHKLKGVDTSDPALKEKIFNLYVESFKKGVYDIIRSDSGQMPAARRRFFSGGFVGSSITLTSGSSLTTPAERLSWVSSSLVFERLKRTGSWLRRSLAGALLVSVLAPLPESPRLLPFLSTLTQVQAEVPQNATKEELADIILNTSGDWSLSDRKHAARQIGRLIYNDTTYYSQFLELYESETDPSFKEALMSPFHFIGNPHILDVYSRTMFDTTLPAATRAVCVEYAGLIAKHAGTDRGLPMDFRKLISELLMLAKTDSSDRVRASALFAFGDFLLSKEIEVRAEIDKILATDTASRVQRDGQYAVEQIPNNTQTILNLNIPMSPTPDLVSFVLEDTTEFYYSNAQRKAVVEALGERADAVPFLDRIVTVAENPLDGEDLRATTVVAAGNILKSNGGALMKKAAAVGMTPELEARFIKLANDPARKVRLAAIGELGDLGGEMSLADFENQLTTELAKTPRDTEMITALETAIAKIKSRMTSVRLNPVAREKMDLNAAIVGRTIMFNRPLNNVAVADLFDVSGRKLSSVKLLPRSNRLELPAGLANKTYVLKVRMPGTSEVYTFRFQLTSSAVNFYSQPDTKAFDAINGGIDLMDIGVETEASSSALKQIKLPSDFAGFSVRVTGRRSVSEQELAFAR